MIRLSVSTYVIGGFGKLSIEIVVSSTLKQHENDEAILDAWVQWALNPTSMSAGYGIDVNYPIIRENLLQRYSVTVEEADRYIDTLKGESDKLVNSERDVYRLREEIIKQVQGKIGERWRNGIKEKIEKASVDAKRAVYLLCTLGSQGFDLKFRTWESILDQFRAYYAAAYDTIFSPASLEAELSRIGVLTRLIWISSKRSWDKQINHFIVPITALEPLGISESDFGQRRDVKQVIEQLFNGHNFEELRLLDEVSREVFGYKNYYDQTFSVEGIKSILSGYGNGVAISPFLLDQVRDTLHTQKQIRINEFGQRIENKLVQLRNELWPEGELAFVRAQGEQFLWRVDSSLHSSLHVYLTLWLTETDLKALFSARGLNAIFLILNQSIPSARRVLTHNMWMSHYRYLELLFPVANGFRSEKIAGERYGYARAIIELISGGSEAPRTTTKAPITVEPKIETVPPTQSKIISAIPPMSPEESAPLAVLLGSNAKGNMIWAPALERNWSLAIVGSAGTGKTQTLKGILYELKRKNIPYLLFDFRNDYLERGLAASEFGKILDLGKISINPLELDASNTPRDQKFQVSDIIDIVYKIGDRQIGYVRDAIQRAYDNRGILEDNQQSWLNPSPTFTDIRHALEDIAEEGTSEVRNSINGIFARLDPVFEYGIFSGSNTVIPFEELVKGQTLVNLGVLPNDSLKAIVCEFLLRKLRYFLYTLSESRDPRLFVVIDEAHRLKYERETSTGQLLKEGRKYGVGLVLATQDPVDFTDLVYNNVGGILSLQLNEPKYAKKVGENLSVSGDALKDGLSEKFSAYVRFSNSPGAVKFKIKPYYERLSTS